MMWWWKRRKLEGLLAASLYEELDDPDRRELDAAVSADPDLCAAVEAFTKLVAAIPQERPPLDRDLLPSVRARLSERRIISVPKPRLVAAAVACCVLLGLFAYLMSADLGGDDAGAPPSSAFASSLVSALDEAQRCEETGDYARAFALLSDAVEGYPDDPLAGEAQYQLASLYFDQGRYPQAYEAFTKLKVEYPGAVAADPERARAVADIRDLLDEARQYNYAALEAYDAACRERGTAIAALEDVIAAYPLSPRVAERAILEMGRRIAAAEFDPGTPDVRLRALELARARCTKPVAVAQLDLVIGDIYRDEMRDFAVAEDHYRKAAEVPVLARRAKEALDALP